MIEHFYTLRGDCVEVIEEGDAQPMVRTLHTVDAVRRFAVDHTADHVLYSSTVDAPDEFADTPDARDAALAVRAATHPDVLRVARFARMMHRGQTYADTTCPRPYFSAHVQAVAGLLPADVGVPYLQAAYAHDVVEDTQAEIEDLRHMMNPRALAAVDALTRRTRDDYCRDYIPRVARNGIARVVKIADLRANLHEGPHESLARWYRVALLQLL